MICAIYYPHPLKGGEATNDNCIWRAKPSEFDIKAAVVVRGCVKPGGNLLCVVLPNSVTTVKECDASDDWMNYVSRVPKTKNTKPRTKNKALRT